MRQITRRGPVWRCADRVQIGYASLKALRSDAGFPDPVSLTFALTCPPSCPHPRRLPAPRRSLRRWREPGSSPFFIISAQTMRAILLASATATSHARLARQHPGQPRIVRRAAPHRPADHRHGARDQQPPQVTLAHLRYLAQLRLAARRVLARHEAEPSGEVAAAPEALHRRCESLDRHRGDRADPRHAHQAPRLLILPRTHVNLPLQARNLRIEAGDLLKQKATQLADRFRQPRSRSLKRRGQPADMSRPGKAARR